MSRGRRVLVWLLAVVGLLAAVAAGAVVAYEPVARKLVAERVIPKLERRLGRDITVGRVDVGWGWIALHEVEVTGPADDGDALAVIEQIHATFDPWKAVRQTIVVHEVRVTAPVISLSVTPEGEDNFSDLLDRLRRRGDDGGTSGDGGQLRPARLRVEDGAAILLDGDRGARVTVGRFDAEADRGEPARATLLEVDARSDLGPHATAERLVIALDPGSPLETARVEIAGGRAAVWPKLSLSGIDGTVAAAGPGRIDIDLAGSYGGAPEKLWHAEGRLEPAARRGELTLKADRFTFDKLGPILKPGVVLEPERTSVETSLVLRLAGDELTFRGDLTLAGLSIYHHLLAEEPVRDLGFRGHLEGRFRRKARLLEIEEASVEVHGVAARLSGFAALPGGRTEEGTRRTEPHVALRLVVPQVTCQEALEAIPPAIVPRLQGFRFAGNFAADVKLEIDWANLDALVLAGSVGLLRCKPVKAPPLMSAERLLGEFEHIVEVEKDSWVAFQVGPSNPDYVPLTDVSPHVMNAFQTTEDSGFYKHRGFVTRQFRSALVRNLKEGYFKYGASSITMQLVKNVLLHREKTLARKFQELVLTHYVESTLPKDRILEIYVNVIEFGPGIYGIGPAARHYFGKHPRDLNPVEAAFFSSILPNPKGRYLQYCEGALTKWGDGKIQRILGTMHERGRLSVEELAVARQTPLVFDRTNAPDPAQCKAHARRVMKNARPTTPKKKPLDGRAPTRPRPGRRAP